MLWGPYPALVDGYPDSIVRGIAYEVQSPTEQSRLDHYGTDAYETQSCLIELDDGTDVIGRTYLWKSQDEQGLRDGDFDPREWRLGKPEAK